MKTVVIIGGGFSGTVTAINLARLSSTPLHVCIVDQSAARCRGVAYSTRNSSHLLNVVARNMSALADQPGHFVEWLSARSEYLDTPTSVLREMFVPRKVYGEYLHHTYQWYCEAFATEKKMRFEWIHDEAKDVALEAGQAKITLKSGWILGADKVVLAVGNQAPSSIRVRGLNEASPKYIGNPWIGWEAKLPDQDQDLLLIGTGLTMVDTFLTLQDLGWQGKIFAVSRNGLLPLPHFKGFAFPDVLQPEDTTMGLRRIFAIFKRHYRAAQAKNLNPAILVDKLRPLSQGIWQSFSPFEKRQFNRHLRTRWNVNRHRIATEIHEKLCRAIAKGGLEIIRGRLSECSDSGSGLKIGVNVGGDPRLLHVGAVINCTGPKESYFPSESTLFNNLISRGTIQADEMKMGIKAGPDFSIRDNENRPSKIIFAIGSLLRGTLWETTAVPELRSQTFRVAETIAGQLSESTPETSSISEVMEV